MVRVHIFQECFENTAGILIDETRDTLHTPTTSEAANCLQRWFDESRRGSGSGRNENKRTGLVIPWIFSRKIMRWRLIPALRGKRKKIRLSETSLYARRQDVHSKTFPALSASRHGRGLWHEKLR